VIVVEVPIEEGAGSNQAVIVDRNGCDLDDVRLGTVLSKMVAGMSIQNLYSALLLVHIRYMEITTARYSI
jgi:hypothetical protein